MSIEEMQAVEKFLQECEWFREEEIGYCEIGSFFQRNNEKFFGITTSNKDGTVYKHAFPFVAMLRISSEKHTFNVRGIDNRYAKYFKD